MPNVTNPGRESQDGKTSTYFIDSVGTVSTTYTYSAQQDSLTVTNIEKGANLTLTVNGTAYTIAGGASQTVTGEAITSFTVVSASGMRSFSALASLGGAEKRTIATSQGKHWSTSAEIVTKTVNGEPFNVLITARKYSLTILALTSSSGEGEGSTDPATKGWVGKLAAALAPLGMLVLNRGFGGNDTTDGMNRFYKDVTPYRPDIVIIAFTLGNEGWTQGGGIGPNMDIYDQFKKNVLKLCHMCRQNNAVPVIVTQVPTQNYDADTYKEAMKLNDWFERNGYATLNFAGVLDNLTGGPYVSWMADTYHPNDMGHDGYYKTINPDFFRYLAAIRKVPKIESPSTRRGAMKYPASTTDNTSDPLMFVPDYTIDSFTVFVRLKNAGADYTGAKTILGLGSAGWRVTTTNDATNNLRLTSAAGTDVITSAVSVNDNLEHSLCLTYSKAGDEVKMYIDGTLIGTAATAGIVLTQVGLGCRGAGSIIPDNMEFWDLAVYRVRLNEKQIRDMHRGRFTIGALDLFCPMDDADTAIYTRPVNLALTDGKLKIKTSGLIPV